MKKNAEKRMPDKVENGEHEKFVCPRGNGVRDVATKTKKRECTSRLDRIDDQCVNSVEKQRDGEEYLSKERGGKVSSSPEKRKGCLLWLVMLPT
uniref:Uncharacterized protein n=2 Tax=Caenorhabditis tropicalis TaxID=1561998 RepID=A0A1I7US58_9PELO